ncbi:defense protein l(2)34Fc [Stomoxys calcitrans]|uniref:defense protein l(2)34Fc n=1 Tax=Stomoxys calcitrans TaxID=35570 RepID=UPI0027E30CC5|nr:defense protein l(2)34Fc [Stomoxys calcitrans]
MLRFLVIACCLAAPAFGYSTGAPREICSNGLTPEHHVPEQTSPVPYFFSGDDLVKGGEKITIKMGGDDFLGFAVQVHDANKKPIGTFKVVEPNKSQTLACSNADDTITHVKISKSSIPNSVQFQWVAPANYKGKARFVGTVAKDGATYWISKVIKEIEVE